MSKDYNDQIRARTSEVVEAILSKHGRKFAASNGTITFALRPERTPSVKFDIAKGLYSDHGDANAGGDVFNLVATLEGLDCKKDFPTVLAVAGGLIGLDPPPTGRKEPVKSLLGPNPSPEDLAANYGLAWSEMEYAGCTIGRRWFKDLSGEADAVIYPIKLRNGSTTEKWKSLARNPIGKRLTGAAKGSGFSQGLFGSLEHARGNTVVLAGGEEKCIAAIKAGFIAVAPTAGEKLTDKVAEWIAESGPSEVIVAFDCDGAGIKGTAKTVAMLRSYLVPKIRTVFWPEGTPTGHDLSDVLKGSGIEGLTALLDAAVEDKPDDKTAQFLQFTDIGRGKRFADKWRGKMLYHAHNSSWMIYDKTRWAQDVGGIEADRAAIETVKGMFVEAMNTPGIDSELIEFATTCTDRRKLRTMTEIGRVQDGMFAHADQFDTDPWAFNVKNGTLDLRTGTLRAHSPTDYITKCGGTYYDPKAKCPLFQKFLYEIMDGNEDIIAFLKRAFGYSMTGSVREHCLFIFHGGGRNGKSTLLQAIMDVLGDKEYSSPIDSSSIFQSGPAQINTGQARPDLVALVGIRFGWVAEGKKSGPSGGLNTELIKGATAGDPMLIRQLHGESFQWKPTAKMFLSTNHKPVIKDTDDGIWSRLRYVPFTQKFEGPNLDKDLPAKIHAELPGILAWMVEGCLEWQRTGLNPPKEVLDATESYRTESDPLLAFFRDCCKISRSWAATKSELFEAYEKYVKDDGGNPLSKRAFGEAMIEKGFKDHRGSKGVRSWLGIKLLDEEQEQPKVGYGVGETPPF